IVSMDNVVISHTSSSQFLDRPFVPFLRVGIPALVSSKPSARKKNGPLRVVHAPSDPVAKGTPAVRSAVASLRGDGVVIDYVELSGISHEAVLNELQRADVVVDQLFSDQPMPGLATEASSLGKAVVIGGYDWQELRRESSTYPWPPTIQIHPDELLSTLRSLSTDP